MSPDNWQRIEDLLDRALDAGDSSPIDEERDPEIAAAARKQWLQHLKASEQGFLEQPIALIRNVLGEALKSDFVPAFEIGSLLLNRFLVTHLLGEGGMGQVYLANDRRRGKDVAIKTIHPALAADPIIRERFIGEINSACNVTHPNVCRIFDLFDDGPVPFCSMEYLPGPTLAEILESGEPLLETTAKSIILQLAEGLHAAHSSGIIHRDYKPQNVILVPSSDPGTPPRAVITDFGLARAALPFTSGHGDGAVAERSLRAGTRDYMAPELIRGAPATFQSDIYAFGKVLEKLLPTSTWIAKTIAPNPRDRLLSLGPLLRDLQGETDISRRTWIIAGTLAVITAGAGGAGYAFYRARQPRFPLMSSRQGLLLNGLRASPGLTDRALTLRQLLIAGLRQSPLLRLIPDERLMAVLRKLKRPTTLPLALHDAVDAAKSERAAIVLDGIVERAARGIRLLLYVFEPGNTAPVLQLERTIDDERSLVDLADGAVTDLRWEFAESNQSRKSSYIPLAQVTSASPEAVDLYFRAERQYERADALGALALINRALAIDPDFVLANHYRAQILLGATQTKSALQSSTRAFDARSRVTERERNWIEHLFYYLSSDYVRALEASRRNQIVYPEEAVFHRQMAMVHCRLGHFQEAIPHSRHAVDLAPDSPSNHNELIANLAEGSDPVEALRSLAQSRKDGIISPLLCQGEAMAYMVLGDYRMATDALRRLCENEAFDRWGRVIQASCHVLEGRFLEALNNLESDLSYDNEIQEERHRSVRLVYAAWLSKLLEQTERSLGHIRAIAALEALPSSMYSFREAAVLASEIPTGLDIAKDILKKLEWIESKWPSTHSRGSGSHIRACLAANDTAAEPLFRQALGLWPDPLTTFSFGNWLARHGRHSECIDVLDGVEHLRGKVIRHYFAGLIGLARIERGKSLMAMSRFPDALRLFDQVLGDWGAHAKDSGVVASLLTLRNHLRSGSS